MKNKYFDTKESIFEITKRYNTALNMLITAGFDNLRDEEQRNKFGKNISFEDALKLKGIDVEIFCTKLVQKLNSENTNSNKFDKTINISGVLPCPVREPLINAFENWLRKSDVNYNVNYELKAASMGVDWIKEILEDKRKGDIPDIFISAGFDLFFDKKFFGKYISENLFIDITGIDKYNKDFVTLKDPDNEYSIIAVVPAVFLINKKELGKRKIPNSWDEILKEEFENSVSLPVGDFDLFNAILLNIYKKYGEEGIKKLGRNMKKDMHPAEMVKSDKKSDSPAITIMPYFFTRMIPENSQMVPIWPKDGAIISPVFMLTKNIEEYNIKPIAKFFVSKEVGEILSHNGRFPSTNDKVDNLSAARKEYMWLGWDYIRNNDIATQIKKCEKIFNNSFAGGKNR